MPPEHHSHDHAVEHQHAAHGTWGRVRHALTPHSHDAGELVDETLEASARGMRALWISFAGLIATAIAQLAVVAISGSVALLGDTVHNVADALTAVPLAIAFVLGRRAATSRFTYGLGRAEDLAGLVVLLVMAASAGFAAYEAIQRLIHPRDIDHVVWVLLAGLIGFAGNEIVARYRITIGRQIGSAALVADGLHARTDGFTSLAVVLAAAGSAAGWQWADPVVGLLITLAILSVLWGAAKEVFARMLDAVDPALVHDAQEVLGHTDGVRRISSVRMRWIGHDLHAEIELDVAAGLTAADAHHIAHDAEHRLLHRLPRLSRAMIHAYPAEHVDGDGPTHEPGAGGLPVSGGTGTTA